jgi:hypothetical protein
MNSNWIHEDGPTYWKARDDKALALIKKEKKKKQNKKKNKSMSEEIAVTSNKKVPILAGLYKRQT